MSGQALCPQGSQVILSNIYFFKEQREIKISGGERGEKGKHPIGRSNQIN